MHMNLKFCPVLTALTLPFVASAADKVNFAEDIKPILESTCVTCHGPEKPKGGFRIDSRAAAVKGGDDGPALVPGDPKKSPLYASTILPAGHDDIMPPKGDPLTKEQTELLRRWIEEGAVWPNDLVLKQTKRIDFVKDIQPLLEVNCLGCHREGNPKGNLRLDNKSDAFKGGDDGLAIVPRRPKKSP